MSIINYAQALNEIADEISTVSEAKGFWPDQDPIWLIATKLALIDSEVAEALEVHRERFDDDEEDPVTSWTPMQEDKFAEEIADIIIRALDLGGFCGFDIGNIVLSKIEINKGRPPKHGKRF